MMEKNEKKKKLFSNNYNRNITGFKKYISPQIFGKKVSLDNAIKKIIELKKNSTGIHFDGLGCDLDGINELINFAEICNASMDHMEGEKYSQFFSYFQSFGAPQVSYGEISKRADLIIYIGNDNNSYFESFYENYFLKKGKKLFKDQINFISDQINFSYAHNFIKVKNDSLESYISDLTNTYLNYDLSSKRKKNEFGTIINEINKCNYGVVVFQSMLENNFLTQRIIELVKKLIIKKKFTLLHLVGNNNSAGFIQSSLWKTGFPNRYNFTDSGPIYDPHNFSAVKIKENKQLQFYISCFEDSPEISMFDKNIFIGNPNLKNTEIFNVYIPSSVPGVDSDGLIVRGDGVCTIKLKKAVDSEYKSVKEIIKLIKKSEKE